MGYNKCLFSSVILCWEADLHCRHLALQANALLPELSQHILNFPTNFSMDYYSSFPLFR